MKTHQTHPSKPQTLPRLSSSSQACRGLVRLSAALSSPVLKVVHTPHMTSSYADSTRCRQLSSAYAPASGTFKIWGSLLQTWVSLSKFHRQSTPERQAGSLTLLCIVWPQQVSGFLVQAHINLQRARKLGTCGRCCQVLIPGLVLPQLPLPLECLPAESG